MLISEITEDLNRRGFLGALAGGAASVAGLDAQAKAKPKSEPVPLNHPNVKILMDWAKRYIKDPAEMAAFMSECAHESDNFKSLEEYSSGEQYEGRKDLGNIYPGDGPRFKGRGFIQITGRWNYTEATKWINKLLTKLSIPNRIDLVQNPKMVAQPTAAALVSLWYWENRSKPKVKDFRNIKQVTKTINPKLKGEKNREAKAKEWQAALHVPKPGKPTRLAQR